jgi:hypothetical protein
MGWAAAAAPTTTTAAAAASDAAPAWATWAALVVSVLALLAAGWSAVSAHRYARSSDSSARSAAATVDLERERRHDELTPRVRVELAGSEDQHEGLWFTSDGPLDYTSVRFRLETPAEVSPVAAFQLSGAWVPVNAERPLESNLGPMRHGDRRFVRYQRADPMPGTDLHLRVTCTNQRSEWTIPVEVYVTPPPFFGVAWR